MARISYIKKDMAPESLQHLFRPDGPQNIGGLLAHAENNYEPLVGLLMSLLTRQKLNAQLREIGILRVAQLSGSEYEWIQHLTFGKMAGVTEDQIAALEKGDVEADCFNALERLVIQFTDQFVTKGNAPEPMVKDLVARLSEQEVVELILAIGTYMAVGRLMNVLDIDLEPTMGKGSASSLMDDYKES